MQEEYPAKRKMPNSFVAYSYLLYYASSCHMRAYVGGHLILLLTLSSSDTFTYGRISSRETNSYYKSSIWRRKVSLEFEVRTGLHSVGGRREHIDYPDEICLLSCRVMGLRQMTTNKMGILTLTGHRSFHICING